MNIEFRHAIYKCKLPLVYGLKDKNVKIGKVIELHAYTTPFSTIKTTSNHFVHDIEIVTPNGYNTYLKVFVLPI